MNRISFDVIGKSEPISRNICGVSINHLGKGLYDSIWVGPGSPIPNVRGIRTAVVEALKRIRPGLVSWPAGPFASEYNWRNGIGPRDARPSKVATHWAGMIENNHFGTHEFMDFCEQVDALPYLSLNLSTGTIREMQEWVEYITVEGGRSPMAELRRGNGRREAWRLPYVVIGNEAWLSGGFMRAEYYAETFRHSQTFVRNLSGDPVKKVACGGRDDDYNWTDTVMRAAGGFMGGLSLHEYVYRVKSATEFGEDEWFAELRDVARKAEIIDGHASVMDRYDPGKKVAICVDEWGLWHEPEPGTNPDYYIQQDTLRDALGAGMYLNMFVNRCSRVGVACLSAANVIHSLLRVSGEHVILNPSYHVFDMYKGHQEATLLPMEMECDEYRYGGESMPGISASASMARDGTVTVTLVNVNPNSGAEMSCRFKGAKPVAVRGMVLTHSRMQAGNAFDSPDEVRPEVFNAAHIDGQELRGVLPPKSVVQLEAETS